MVLRVLQDQRGWQPTQLPQDGLPTADFMMQTEHGTRLVACKHGRGYRIGVAAVNELGAMARLAGANGGVMVTEGRMEREGMAAADKQSIEVLDGARLWPLLKPYLPGDIETGVVGAARRRAIRHTVIAGAAAATLGVVMAVALQPAEVPPAQPLPRTSAPLSPAPGAASAAPPAVAPAPASAAQAATSTPAATPVAAGDEPDLATLQGYQREVSKALAQTPGLVRGIWLTQLTLAVDRTVDDATAWPLICRELERYPTCARCGCSSIRAPVSPSRCAGGNARRFESRGLMRAGGAFCATPASRDHLAHRSPCPSLHPTRRFT